MEDGGGVESRTFFPYYEKFKLLGFLRTESIFLLLDPAFSARNSRAIELAVMKESLLPRKLPLNSLKGSLGSL